MSADELDPKTFNVDEWLSGVTRVTKMVEVYGRPHLQAEIDELDALASDAEGDERDDLHAQADELREEMEASRVRFKVASLREERVEVIRKQFKPKDLEGPTFAIMSEQIVHPVMTADQLRALRDAIGDGYFAQTLTATCLAAQQGLAVTVPFSSAASRARKR